MNNKTKGWVAAGLGGALLLGTGGTFALWSDSADLGQATIGTGDLSLGDDVSVAWAWRNVSHGDIEEAPTLSESTKLVPGDAIEGVLDLSGLTLTGDTLVANLYIDGKQVAVDDAGAVSIGGVASPLEVKVTGLEELTFKQGEGFIFAELTEESLEEAGLGDVTVTLGFPALPLELGGSHPAAGRPGPDLNGYGRNLKAITLGDIELRLEQQLGDDALRVTTP